MTKRIISGFCTEEEFDLTPADPEIAKDFDMEAANDEYFDAYCECLEKIRPDWDLLSNGDLIIPISSPLLSDDERDELDFLLNEIDTAAILQRHDISE